MKKFFYGIATGLVAGIIISSAGFYFFSSKEKDKNIKDVTVKQVYGEKIEHAEFNYKGDTITFETEAQGKGKIVTEIPKTNIPEARYWMQNTNAVMLELLLIDRRVYGLSYLKRWDNFSVGGGVLLSEDKFEGFQIQAQYWFKL